MKNPCVNCITFAVCQNKTMKELWADCYLYVFYKQSRGWNMDHNGQLLCTRSEATTTTVNIGWR